MNWNPYFVAYAATHGRTCQAQIEHDREAWPGGSMCGFILWMQDRWTEWRTLRRIPRLTPCAPLQGAPPGFWIRHLTEDERSDFSGWLRGHAFRAAELQHQPPQSHDHQEAPADDVRAQAV